jgi:membrane protein YdbS with pleckstrin-like domain
MTQLTNAQFAVVFAISAVVGAAVWIHADRHGSKHPTAWGIAAVLAPALVVIIYIVHNRRRRRSRAD